MQLFAKHSMLILRALQVSKSAKYSQPTDLTYGGFTINSCQPLALQFSQRQNTVGYGYYHLFSAALTSIYNETIGIGNVTL